MSYTAYVGLGSNLPSKSGDPAATVRAAALALAALGGTKLSSLYRTAPVGLVAQPDFVNAALELRTDVAPEPLLAALLRIEECFGRDRSAVPPKGPRTLDLDLLIVTDRGDESIVCRSDRLTLPHPEMARRRFVLRPLAEIAPNLRHPTLGRTVGELLFRLETSGEGGEVRKL